MRESTKTIYLDHNATTRPDPQVVAVVSRCLRSAWGNPSSLHSGGLPARTLLERSRTEVARLIGAQPQEIVFTSGGTEANNQVLLGLLLGLRGGKPGHVITTSIEHQAVLRPCQALVAAGWRVTCVTVDGHGRVDPAAVAAALQPDTALVSVMLANNETGVLQPVREIAALLKAQGIPLHTDAVQAAGRIPVDVAELGVDFLSASGHKFYGPKGIGVLFVRHGRKAPALLLGGKQEMNRRAGTENLPGIAGLAKACELARSRLAADAVRMRLLRDRFEDGLRASVPDADIHGAGVERLPNTVFASFPGVNGTALALNLDVLGVRVSTGSACSSVQRQPPHVLTAMGCTTELAMSSVRFSLGRDNTEADVDRVLQILARIVPRLASL